MTNSICDLGFSICIYRMVHMTVGGSRIGAMLAFPCQVTGFIFWGGVGVEFAAEHHHTSKLNHSMSSVEF